MAAMAWREAIEQAMRDNPTPLLAPQKKHAQLP